MRKLKLFLDAKAANTPPRGISKASRVIFSVLTLLLLSIGQVWGADEVVYTLNGTSTGGSNGYATESDITQSDISWKVMGNTTMNPWRIGGKSITNVVRIAYSTNAISDNITKVVVSYGTFSLSSASAVLKVYSTAEDAASGSSSNLISTVSGNNGATPASNAISANATHTFTRPDGDDWSGRYFRFEFTCTYSSNDANKFFQFKRADFYKAVAADVCAIPTFSKEAGNIVAGTQVTISTETEGAAIRYTTNGDTPDENSTLYEGAITVNEDMTINAIAIKSGYTNSNVASVSYTALTPLTTMQAIFDKATEVEGTATAVAITFNNWVVTGVKNSNAYVTDGTKGFIIYTSNHGFAVGNVLSGTAICKVQLYNGSAELTELPATKVTVNTGGSVSPVELDAAGIEALSGVNTGSVIKISGACTYENNKYYIAGVQLYNQLYSFSVSAGTNYECTGVYVLNTTYGNEILPRSAADIVVVAAATLEEVTGLAALKAESTGASYIVDMTDAVVTLVDGNNAFIEDATAGALIYYSGHGLAAGDKLNGKYEVTTATYQGKFEITAMEAQTGATKVADAEIPVTTLTIAELDANFSSYESRRVKIAAANVTDAVSGSDRNGAINDGAALAVYAAAGASTITLTADDNVDIIGYPGFHNTDQQLNVWRQEDITVNVKEDPELAYNPTVVNVLLSDLASFTPAVLEYATGFDGVAAITYESSDPSIATVETDGTVTLVATAEGSTTITATFSGNATYKADNASYTINVSAAPIAPVYTMSFDMTRASYDVAADAQVVWNSSVVTMTADKNDGTKVTNYLAGNYTGTTLIAETRFYAKNSISFVPQEGVSITKIEWMSTAKGYATNLAAETFVNATAAVDGTDDKLVIITPSAAGEISVTLTAPARATAVTVYYEAESEKAKLDASIAIANINTAVGDDDILLSDIAATSNPNKKAISYAITSGTAVSLVGEGKDAAFHAVEAGTATITATIPNDLGNYTGATQTFDIIVSAGPATLESIAISGTASVLEYTEGQYFNPAGLVVTGHYSDNTDAEISEGITWAFDPSPLTAGTTSVSVIATVSEINSAAFEVNGLTVSTAPTPTTDNVVILAVYNEKYYAMSTNNASSAFTAIAVEYDGTKVTVKSEAEKTAIQWTRKISGDNITFQTKDEDKKYMKGVSNGASMSLADDACNWSWDATNEYYHIGSRSFFYQAAGGYFKNFAISDNMGKSGYSNKAQVIVIDPANIVITSKVSAELAYDPASDEITQGDAWTAPALVNPHSVTITSYASDNEAVATVDGGVIALAGGIGTAHITAHFDGDGSYLEGDAVYTITVNAPAPVVTGTTYRKVTSTEDITNGDYLIVYEATSVAFNGALENLDVEGNSVAVTINEGVISGTTAIDAAVFTIEKTAGTLKSASGKYIGVSSNSNGLKQTEDASMYTHTFSIDGDGNAVIFANFEGSTMKLRYNSSTSAGNLRFRYYKNDGQQAIQLYKRDAYTRTVTEGRYGTICLPRAGKMVGASIYEIAYFGQASNKVFFDEIVNGEMVAGMPYVFLPNENVTELKVVYTSTTEEEAQSNNGLHGTLSAMTNILASDNIYLVYQNQILHSTVDGSTLAANRAYIKLDEIDPQEPALAPGRRRVSMGVQGEQVATAIDGLNATEVPVKVLINGQLFIIRGEKMYNVNGQVVK